MLQVVRGCAYIGGMQMERDAEASCKRANKLGVIFGRRTANAMVDVYRAQVQVPSRREFVKHMQQEDRIRAARDRDAKPLANINHPVARDGRKDTLTQHGFIVSAASM